MSKLTAKIDRENRICLENSKPPNSAHYGASRNSYQHQQQQKSSQLNTQNSQTIAVGDKHKESKEVGRGHFDFDFVIGKGGFGKVWSVEMKKNGQIYAMK